MVCVCVMYCLPVIGGEYIVQEGDVIGIVAEKTGCSIEQLAQLNSIEAPKYVVQVDTMLRYVSQSDLKYARKWLEEYILSLTEDNVEYASFSRMILDIDANNIQYGDGLASGGARASEIILLSSVYQNR